MKNFKLLAITLLLSTIFLFSCQRVAPNYVGVLMENYGKAGKDDFSIVKGRVSTMFSPGSELFQVPLWEQRADFGDKTLHLKVSNQSLLNSLMYKFITCICNMWKIRNQKGTIRSCWEYFHLHLW